MRIWNIVSHRHLWATFHCLLQNGVSSFCLPQFLVTWPQEVPRHARAAISVKIPQLAVTCPDAGWHSRRSSLPSTPNSTTFICLHLSSTSNTLSVGIIFILLFPPNLTKQINYGPRGKNLVLNLALLLSCMALGMSFKFFWPQLPYLENRYYQLDGWQLILRNWWTMDPFLKRFTSTRRKSTNFRRLINPLKTYL